MHTFSGWCDITPMVSAHLVGIAHHSFYSVVYDSFSTINNIFSMFLSYIYKVEQIFFFLK